MNFLTFLGGKKIMQCKDSPLRGHRLVGRFTWGRFRPKLGGDFTTIFFFREATVSNVGAEFPRIWAFTKKICYTMMWQRCILVAIRNLGKSCWNCFFLYSQVGKKVFFQQHSFQKTWFIHLKDRLGLYLTRSILELWMTVNYYLLLLFLGPILCGQIFGQIVHTLIHHISLCHSVTGNTSLRSILFLLIAMLVYRRVHPLESFIY